jgi:ubiquitin-protein ligase E3 C
MFTSGSMLVEDDSTADDEVTEITLNRDLEQQICNAIEPRFLLQLVCGRNTS